MHNEVVAPIVLDDSSADELLHHFGGERAGLHVFLQLHDLLLQRMDFIILRGLFGLLLRGLCLVLLDLLLGAAPLRGCLQHVRRDALGGCQKR